MTGRSPRALRALLAAVVLLSGLVVAQAGAAAQYDVVEIARVRRGGPREVTIRIEFEATDPRGLMALIGVEKKNGRNRLGFAGIVEHAQPMTPTTYGTGAAGVSEPLLEMPAEGVYETVIGPFDKMRFFVVTDRATAKVTVDTPYWRVRRSSLGVRRVLDENTGGTGVRTLTGGVERFSAATAPGGRYGSMVWAAVPCAGLGTGSATLDGTTAPIRLACGSHSTMTSHPSATTWDLRGSVTGQADTVTRLFVVDFPR